MAQNYTLMARKNLLKPSEAPKYSAVARSGRKVTVKEVCKRITERSSYSKGELEGCIGEFLLEIVNVLDEGNIVQMGDLGNHRRADRPYHRPATVRLPNRAYRHSYTVQSPVFYTTCGDHFPDRKALYLSRYTMP